ncbi:MAG: hypothetical protein AAFR27_08055, partial [Pseudomonadota bacterium]
LSPDKSNPGAFSVEAEQITLTSTGTDAPCIGETGAGELVIDKMAGTGTLSPNLVDSFAKLSISGHVAREGQSMTMPFSATVNAQVANKKGQLRLTYSDLKTGPRL